MDFQRFGIDPRLALAAEGLPTNFFFYEKMLTHVVEKQENVCVKIALDNGREEVLLLPALQWLLSGEGRKVLVVVPDADSADRCSAAIGRLGSGAGVGVRRARRDEAAEPQVGLDGDPEGSVLMGTIEDLLSLPELGLRDYGFLVVDGVDRLTDLPPDAIRKFCGGLLPSWERRSVLACARFTVKAKNLAWDLADNPSEISIEGEVAKAQSVLKETWSVPVESKLKFLLGLLEREKPARLCVFCNLKDTASEIARRLAANGINTDSILGMLLPERKFALIEKFRAGDCTCLVLTDEGADGLSPGVFPLIINYDIPLEPELFVKRLEMLDRSDPGAKVVSLACDRYIYGLPAVEQYIDAKLDALPAGEAMLSAVDRSEGMGAQRKPRGEAPQRDSRRGQPQRRESYPRDSRPRDANRMPNSPRDSNRFHDSPRDSYPREGRSPDIRKSISEATGGALDMSGALPPDAVNPRPQQERQAPGKAAPRGQQAQQNRPAGKKEGRRNDSRRQEAARGGGKASGPRSPDSRQSAPRQQAGKPDAGKPGNPYDMPMEERMKLYREKYGQGIGKDKAAGRGGQRNPQQQGGQRGGRGPAQRSPKPAQGGQPDQAQRARDPGRPDSRPLRPANAPSVPQPQPPSGSTNKPEGVVGRLLGAFRKKKA